jgi:hypothetical protein
VRNCFAGRVLETMDAMIGLSGIVHRRMAGMNLIAARNALKQAFGTKPANPASDS